jgi:hypothetical protein
MTTTKSTARTTTIPLSRRVVGESVLMMPLNPGRGDGLVWVEDDVNVV